MIIATQTGFRDAVFTTRALLERPFFDPSDAAQAREIDQLESALEALQMQCSSALLRSETELLSSNEYEVLRRAEELYREILGLKASRRLEQLFGGGGSSPVAAMQQLLGKEMGEIPAELKGLQEILAKAGKAAQTMGSMRQTEQNVKLQSGLRFFIFACALLVPIRAVR